MSRFYYNLNLTLSFHIMPTFVSLFFSLRTSACFTSLIWEKHLIFVLDYCALLSRNLIPTL